MGLIKIIIILIIVSTVYKKIKNSESFAIHNKEKYAMHQRQSSNLNPGFGQQLGALERLHEQGFVSRNCMEKANRDTWDGPGFSDLVDCLQGNVEKPAINNLNV
jgi:hypothetical protein